MDMDLHETIMFHFQIGFFGRPFIFFAVDIICCREISLCIRKLQNSRASKCRLSVSNVIYNDCDGKRGKGLALDSDWVISESSQMVVLTISQETGVITISFGSEVDGGGRTLTLVPVLPGPVDGYALAGNANSSSFVLDELQIEWVCAADKKISKNTIVIKHKGTLPSKYTPLGCRM